MKNQPIYVVFKHLENSGSYEMIFFFNNTKIKSKHHFIQFKTKRLYKPSRVYRVRGLAWSYGSWIYNYIFVFNDLMWRVVSCFILLSKWLFSFNLMWILQSDWLVCLKQHWLFLITWVGIGTSPSIHCHRQIQIVPSINHN